MHTEIVEELMFELRKGESKGISECFSLKEKGRRESILGEDANL